MARYRVAETQWRGHHICYIVSNSDIAQGNKGETLINRLQENGKIAFLSIEDKGVVFGQGHTHLINDFLQEVDVSRLKYGPIENI